MLDRAVATALAGALTIAFSGILVRLADVAPETAAFFRCLYALPALGVLAWLERRRLGARPPRRLVLAAAGLCFAADLVFWHHAIADVGAGLATVLGNLQVVLVAFVAWAVLAERPEARVLAAVPVALTGVVLISGVLEEGAYGADPARGVLFGGLTSLAYALFILLLRSANAGPSRPAGPLLESTAWSAAGCLVAGEALGTLDPLPGWPAQGWLVLLALSAQVLGWMLISWSLPRLPAALTSVLLLAQPVAAVLLAMALLGEDPSPVQLGGVAVVLSAIAVATVRR
ncbi:MAG TPA: DMT family transporter [Solirubrobacteraceae bacterium]|jgi:drug/metabolite transporter (DMT)-like permease|nr:DMT family transporter [Solirubrobacteraceae bacterium]